MSHLDPFALIKTAVERTKAVLTPAPRSAASQSNGPPPLPAADPASRDSLSLEDGFFHEGIDGRAESIPDDDSSPALTVASLLAGGAVEATGAAEATIPPALLHDALSELDEAAENPERTRRRRAARAGAAWGGVGALVLAAVAVCVSPGREGRRSAVAHATPPPVETAGTHAAVTLNVDTAPGQELQALPVAAPAPEPVVATAAPEAVASGAASCRPGMVPSVVAHETCVDVADRFLCARDPRTHARRPVGCLEAKSPRAACEARGERLATHAEQQRAGGKRRSAAGAFRCAGSIRG